MAKFLEYQGKEWLAKGGMPVPKGRVASSPEEAEEAARWIGGPVAVKGQVQAGGRGKAGIVKLADTPEEARALAEEILAKTVKGLPVEKVLIEEKLDIKKEYYCSFVINNAREARCPMLMFSTEGGMDIESVQAEHRSAVWPPVLRRHRCLHPGRDCSGRPLQVRIFPHQTVQALQEVRLPDA